ncbi:MAG TPA: MSMEG_1061 family FMN-dependent PPOX-type flavoprotein [Planctomycetota bacterium]|jgi:PPOX class probable FMN-dependent enzyme|nr:MSMEG_1061 family FMN-dependent PPOX-type flavoprotein [Planctomycetota bacterium]
MNPPKYDQVIDSAEALRKIIPPPSELVVRKALPALDAHARSFIARSPFVVVATCGTTTGCDVSPRGEAPGGFLVLDDHTLAVGDRPGNRRTDSFLNLLENPKIALLFLVPGVDETLRVNGRAKIVVDAGLFEKLAVGGKAPLLALVVEIEEVFFQCGKAFRRSRLWEPATWPDPKAQPSLACVLGDQIPEQVPSVETLDRIIQDAYRNGLY